MRITFVSPLPAKRTVAAVAERVTSRWRRLRATTLLLPLLIIGCESSTAAEVQGQLSVTPNGQTVQVGGVTKVYATGFAAGGSDPYVLGNVTWSSSDESIAQVTSSRTLDLLGAQSEATIVGVQPGTARITAMTQRAGAGSAEVVVVP